MDRTSRGYRAYVAAEHRVLGAAFLVLLVLLGWTTYAVFNQKFTDFAEVSLHTSRVGLQLGDRADVKIRGVVVGQVRAARATGDGAVLTLGIFPRMLGTIPANVSARILPKTLFGEKYVALEVPGHPDPTPLAAGAVIAQTHVAIEVERVLNDIYPLLRTVQPAQLNYTLTAVADALEGRGARLGESLTVLDGYLQRMNPQIPALVEDLGRLSQVSDVYRSVMPEVARLLRNSVVTGATVVEKEQKIEALFTDVTALSSTSKDFLEQNGSNIIRLGKLGQASLPTFAKYAPEYPCLVKGIVDLAPLQAEIFRDKTLHIVLETLPKQPRAYGPQDQARYADKRGPNCIDLPHPPYTQQHLPPSSVVPDINDGVDEPTGKTRAPALEPAVDLTSGFAGTAAERDLVDALAAPVLGVSTDLVPDVASLLFAPLARGAEVSVR